MSDDAIRAALDAAQKQASSFYSLGETAQIIAAFLRALSDANVPYPPPHWSTGWTGQVTRQRRGRITAVCPERFAAAVERAAQEDQR